MTPRNDRRSNNCRYVEDAASIRVNAGSVGYDSYCCCGPNDRQLAGRGSCRTATVCQPSPDRQGVVQRLPSNP